jgi:hypothetical protein
MRRNAHPPEIDWICVFDRIRATFHQSYSGFQGYQRANVIYTGDGSLDTQRRWESFRDYIHPQRAVGSLVLQVMHHGAQGNWRPGLAGDILPHVSVFSSDPLHRRFRHPHPPVLKDFGAVSRVAQADRRRGVGFAAWF